VQSTPAAPVKEMIMKTKQEILQALPIAELFEEHALGKEYWQKVEKDLKV